MQFRTQPALRKSALVGLEETEGIFFSVLCASLAANSITHRYECLGVWLPCGLSNTPTLISETAGTLANAPKDGNVHLEVQFRIGREGG